MAYPVSNPNVLLSNSVAASTTVNLVGGMQVSTTVFSTGASPNMGTVVLSPMQPQLTNLTFGAGQQVVNITLIAFVPAFGLTPGSVVCSGTATDPLGKNPVAFYNVSLIAWTN